MATAAFALTVAAATGRIDCNVKRSKDSDAADNLSSSERALRHHIRSEKTLRQYSITVLRELCAKRRIQVDVGCLRPLKKPYIEALLTHVR